LTAARQIGGAPFAIIEVFHLVPHIAAHPCKDPCRHDKVDQRCLQHNCCLQGIQSQHVSKIKDLQLLCHSELWISTGAHVLDLYFRLQKTDMSICYVTVSLCQ
jgi:hypothetical protein